MILPGWVLYWIKRPFWVVLGGTGLAQAIGLLASPLLSRLYSPESFGLFALFSTMVGLSGAVLGGRYEFAITGEVDEDRSDVLISVVMLFSILLTLLFSVVFFVVPLDDEYVKVGPAVLTGGMAYVVGVACNNWLIRQGMFPVATSLKVLRAVFALLISLALFQFTSGLVWSGAVAYILLAFASLKACNKRGWSIKSASLNDLYQTARHYLKFPVYGLLPAVFDNLSILIPIYWAADLFGSDDVGQWGLARMVIAGPMSMVSSAVAQVLMKRISDAVTQSEPIGLIVRGVLLRFCMPVLAVCLLLTFWGQPLFEIVFGQNWLVAGHLSGWLVWAFAINAACSMISIALIILRRLVLNGVWQIGHCLAIFCLFFMVPKTDFETFIQYFVAIEVVSYLIYALLVFYASHQHDRKVLN